MNKSSGVTSGEDKVSPGSVSGSLVCGEGAGGTGKGHGG